MGHLTLEQRYTIQVLREEKLSQQAIANRIGKDKSVVSREIRRTADKRTGTYKAELAQRKYTERMASKPKACKFTEEIKTTVDKLLANDYSPEQIAGRCKLEGRSCVSHERIYQYIWEDKMRKGQLYLHLRHHGRKYRKRGAAKDSRGKIRDQVSIDERPEIVASKIHFGDLEMDTVLGKNHKGAILTINDRATKLCWIRILTSRESEPLAKQVIEALTPLQSIIQTITVDNGKEFALHKAITQQLKIPIYFAHPYHSWERGANENMNGLIRQYLPKGISFEGVTEAYVLQIQQQLNNRPRKSLGYLTPKEYAFAKFGIVITAEFKSQIQFSILSLRKNNAKFT